MRLGIMQPYFFPYLGYWQLMNLVDKFVVYDNIEYTKKGWINRNCYLCGNDKRYFTIPLEKSSDFLDIREKMVSKAFDREKVKKQIACAYRKAPYYREAYPVFCDCIAYPDRNLFEYIYYSITKVREYLGIRTELVIASSTGIGRELKGRDKVLAICKKLGGDTYVNPIGGLDLYDKQDFAGNGVDLMFVRMDNGITYPQMKNSFVSNLSILDVMMFNSREEISRMLEKNSVL